jgi:hypothetical protein
MLEEHAMPIGTRYLPISDRSPADAAIGLAAALGGAKP